MVITRTVFRGLFSAERSYSRAHGFAVDSGVQAAMAAMCYRRSYHERLGAWRRRVIQSLALAGAARRGGDRGAASRHLAAARRERKGGA